MYRCRLAAVAAVFCLVCGLAACKPEEVPPPPEKPVLDAYRGQYQELEGFSALSAEQQENYDALFTAVTERLDVDTVVQEGETSGPEHLGLRVELPRELSDGAEVAALYNAFLADNPQLFYIGSTYTYEGYKVGDRAHYNVLYLTLTMNAAERKEAAKRLDETADTVLAGLAEKTDLEKELAIHDRLIARCVYDDKAAASEMPDAEYPFAFTAYGALVEGKAVCEGYARAFQLLCRRAGLPCVTVNGVDLSNNTAHMWNLVTVDGAPYHVDVTWDDQLDAALHVYFNQTTEEISRTHRLDADSAGKDCTATAAGYYRATGRYQERYDREEIAKAVAAEVQVGATVVELRFPPERLASIGLFVQNRTWFSETVDACLPEGVVLWDYDFHLYSPYGVRVLCRKGG
ncbi:MAG: hypothetical protein IJZ13_02885 [Clostridia bacterium]|nr:hypothetical protein [Clostridia bacterium]